MAVDFKGKIRYNPDCKPSEPEYKISCKALEISEEGSGNMREMMEDLTEKITDKISSEFRTTPQAVRMVGFSMSVDFSVEGPVNRTLGEFSGDYTATVRFADGEEVALDKLTKTANAVIARAKRTGQTVDEVLAEAKAELARQKKAEGAKS